MIRLLFVGDIVGEPGLRSLELGLKQLIPELKPDLIVANGENAAKEGKGLSFSVSEKIWDAGVEILTLGNHTWDHRDMEKGLCEDKRIVRPANYPSNPPGQGFTYVTVKGKQVLIVNLLGRAFMADVDCPFQTMDTILAQHEKQADMVFVDIHAETTSEKLAMAFEYDGRVSAMVGTHTHVQTADDRILPKGTGYLTDVGMCGSYNGILGVNPESVIRRFRTQRPVRFDVYPDNHLQFSAVVVDLDDQNSCSSISRIHLVFNR